MRSLWISRSLALSLLCASAGMAAGPSFAGTWKINLAKSKLTGTTYTISKTPAGLIHYDGEGFAFDFDLAGKEYPAPDGSTVAYKSIDANTWEGTMWMNKKVIGTFRFKLDKDTVSMTMKAIKADGSTTEQTQKATRVSGGPGFFGKWKSTEVGGTPGTMVIALEGANGISVTYPDYQEACKGNFDGKDNPISGAGANTKMTLAFEKAGANGFKMTTKIDGKLFFVESLTLSADGKTLTDEATPTAVKEPTTTVYERQ